MNYIRAEQILSRFIGRFYIRCFTGLRTNCVYLGTDPGPAGVEMPGVGGDIPASMLQPCLDDMFHMQQVIRSEREKVLMSQFGLPGVCYKHKCPVTCC